MKNALLNLLLSGLLVMAGLAACGGGGGGGGTPPPQLINAIVTLSTAGTLASGTKIGSIDITINLPDGVSIKATPDSNNPSILITDSGAVAASGAASGSNALSLSTYTAATSSAPGKLIVKLINADGFATGEFAVINCDIASGKSPATADFSVAGFDARDLNGAAITGLTAGFTAEMK